MPVHTDMSSRNRNSQSKQAEKLIREVKKNPKILIFIAAVLIIACIISYATTGSFIPIYSPADTGDEPTFHFIDVGQGDSTLITYNGEAVLIDAGPESSGASTAEYVWMYAQTIDYFVITHPHEDHMGGAVDVLEKCDVECIIMPEDVSKEHFFKDTLSTAERLGIEVVVLEGASTYILDGITVEIADNSDLDHDDLNNASLFVKVTAGSTTCLFTGDAEYSAETFAVGNYGKYYLDCDIFQAGHHGSKTSNSVLLLDYVTPDICVISCGRDNSYGHPHGVALSRLEKTGAEIRRTDLEGTVVIKGKK